MNCPLCGGYMKDYQSVCPFCEDGKKIVCRGCKRIIVRDPNYPFKNVCGTCSAKEVKE